jgi:repressor LexA
LSLKCGLPTSLNRLWNSRTKHRTGQCVLVIFRAYDTIVSVMKPLSDVQQSLLAVLIDTIDEPLTIRELQDRLDISSPSVVHHHVQQLEKKGYLRRNPSNPRDYQVMGGGAEKQVAYLNMYGLAKCGPNGTLLDGNPVDRIPFGSRMLGFNSEEAFFVKAKGDSMEPRIHDGDYVLCRKTHHAQNGDVVICAVNGESMIKRLQYEDKGPVLLLSLNTIYAPIVVDPEALQIEGKVRGVFSYL